jgi:hypothetical protein
MIVMLFYGFELCKQKKIKAEDTTIIINKKRIAHLQRSKKNICLFDNWK